MINKVRFFLFPTVADACSFRCRNFKVFVLGCVIYGRVYNGAATGIYVLFILRIGRVTAWRGSRENHKSAILAY